MSVRNDIMEGSTFRNPVQALLNGDDVPSLEDQAWADSCLVEDSEITNSDWDFFKNALEEIGTSHRVQYPVPEIDDLSSSRVERIDDSSSSDGEDIEDSDGDLVLDKVVKSRLKKTGGVYPFRPNYSEHLQENESSELGLDFDFSDFTGDQFTEDIFKVWDLDIPAGEEDELVTKQLIPVEKSPATFSDLEALKDLKDDTLDDLINGISDLALDM